MFGQNAPRVWLMEAASRPLTRKIPACWTSAIKAVSSPFFTVTERVSTTSWKSPSSDFCRVFRSRATLGVHSLRKISGLFGASKDRSRT
ncbi:hypothetical protein D3C86_1995130 [compost metagenome]